MMRRLWIEPVAVDVTALDALTSPEERALAAGFSPSRRREFLTWRALVRRELGADTQIAYNAVGAPVLLNRNLYLSVSHGAGHVAVCISDAPCAVDIESPDRNFSRVSARYISSAEALLSADAALPAVLWCAKEALYKYAGRPGLDFLHDLQLHTANLSPDLFANPGVDLSPDLDGESLTGTIENGEPLRLSVYRGDGYIAVAIF